MKRGWLVVGLLSVTVAVPAAASLVRQGPSALPAPPLGHPGHPVVVGQGGLVVSGPVGSIVHVRIPLPLPVPDPYDRDGRFTLTGTGDWSALLLSPEKGQGAAGQLALVSAAPSVVCQGPCPEDASTIIAVAYAQAVSAGDYVLALAGPRGTTVSAQLVGRDPTVAPTVVRHLYPMPFVSGSAPDPAGTVTPHRKASAGLAAATVGRRSLGVVVVGAHERGVGRNVDISFCGGGYRPNKATTAVQDAAQATCSGGDFRGSSGVAAKIPLDPTIVSPPPFAVFAAQSGTSFYEINSGGGWAATCLDDGCTFDGRVFDVALDS